MADNNKCLPGCSSKEAIILDVARVLDSCRDKDCFEDVKVFLDDCGQEIIEKTGNIRVKNTEVVRTSLCVEPVKFNRGFYSVDVRFYVKLSFEACICAGKVSEFEGLAVCDKKVILYGGEGNVSVFRSGDGESCCAPKPFGETKSGSLPFAVCEVADPIALDLRVVRCEEKCGCCFCYVDELPDCVTCCFGGRLSECDAVGHRELLVSLGFFSVIRLERPGQYLVSATECCVPEKECACGDIDPCSVFRKMDFPVGEFCTSGVNASSVSHKKDCSCKDVR